jgi:hypothetical protein
MTELFIWLREAAFLPDAAKTDLEEPLLTELEL